MVRKSKIHKTNTRRPETQRSLIRRQIVHLLKVAGAQLIELVATPLTVRYKGFRALSPRTLQKIINSLIYDGELERRGKDKYYLTDAGAAHLLPLLKPVLATDGQTRILVFDIPESHRGQRDTFRRHIKMLGFKQHQLSVWVSKYRCEDWIDWLINYHEVEDYTSLYIGKLIR